ncbi:MULTISPECIES: cadherin-like beta sandwich domain-containing protein [unclassified Oceanispirochaeta]|uniref:cadherin-like beta sandwich domain-containing protein n=1 Tax=unclassified Oceanispirochaeta TaxID=2635722 RepID=UPI000E093B86|nr:MULTISPECIES: cadherin-like beta sandwich domain-containing protein [unclassified Oceanispirochaeta]MBF9017257.1 cadherin-like beta sandwich domain-containing protein [Oceanispirochaeta sp. M2]NPD73706.1 cadherin-like beta sandwich domain-containing protein [Oceanispirochaeta sp. M1]RDG30633.1 hypothetical protein DV872_16555 [Oceanispirochaeta sp. M1]
MYKLLLTTALVLLLVSCRDSQDELDNPSSENYLLSSLSVSEGVLEPAFSPDTHEYTVDLTTDTTSLSIYASSEEGLSVSIDGTISGSKVITLYPEENTVDVIVTSEDGENTSEYSININCARYLREPERYQLDTSMQQKFGLVCENSNGDKVSISSMVDTLYAMHYIDGSGFGQLVEIGSLLYNESDFDAVIDSDGNILVVYAHRASNSSPEIFYVAYKPGTGWSSPTLLSPSGENTNSFQLILDENETPIISLYTSNKVLSSVFSFSSGWSTLVEVDSNNGVYSNLQLIQAGDKYYIFWQNLNNINPVVGAQGIYYSVRTEGGQWSNPIQLYNKTIVNFGLNADGNSQGEICITFTESSSTVSGSKVVAIYYRESYGWGTPVEISNSVVGGGRAELGIDETGNVLIAYIGDGLDQDTWTNRYMAGVGWSGPSLTLSGGATDHVVTSIADYTFILVFNQYIPSIPSLLYYSIFNIYNGWEEFKTLGESHYYFTAFNHISKVANGDTAIVFAGKEYSSSMILLHHRWYK